MIWILIIFAQKYNDVCNLEKHQKKTNKQTKLQTDGEKYTSNNSWVV